MKLAIVADWLPTLGGAERVIAALHSIWPEAPIYTTVANRGKLGVLDKADIVTSGLQFWYELINTHQPLLPWMPRSIEAMDLDEYDVILSSSHAVAKGVVPSSSAVHICYCHTPMRYAWEMEQTYINDFKIPKKLQPRVRNLLRNLRRWDMTTAMRTDHFIANSNTTKERIERIYARQSTVIHPPVSDHFLDEPFAEPSKDKPFLAFGRMVPYKRFDLLIEVANRLKIPLRIAGTGQDSDRLKDMAGPTVEFTGFVPQDRLGELYRSSRALLHPQFEDAGVIPLEAQACGIPVIALGKGGALDTVINGETGVYFDEQSPESLQAAFTQFESMTFDPEAIRTHASRFRESLFCKNIKEFVESKVSVAA